ncbi:benzoate 1,2-dioxygenase large subunit, partial [Acinetobacter baumannii]|nr:benzoate 1,2-dioxygenase large subunit [Acinetobacter baumannii]
DMCRGWKHWVYGPDAAANELGVEARVRGSETEEEGLYLVQHQYWLKTMKHAIASEKEIADQGETA